MVELWINGRVLNGDPENIPEISRSIGTVGEIADRAGDYATSVEIEMTAENLSICENSTIFSANTDFPYRFQFAKLKSGGHSIFENGSAILERIEDDKIVFSCFGSLVTLAKILDGLPARDLFMPEIDYQYSLAVFLQNNTWENGFIFSEIYVTAISVVRTPCLFAAYVFRKLFESQGYTVVGNIFSDADFTSALIPMQARELTFGKRKKEEQFFDVTFGSGNDSSGSVFMPSGDSVNLVGSVLLATHVSTVSGTIKVGVTFNSPSESFVGDSAASGRWVQDYQIYLNGIPQASGLISVNIGDIITAYCLFQVGYSDYVYPGDPIPSGGGEVFCSWSGGRMFLQDIKTTVSIFDDCHFEQILPAEWTQLMLFKEISKMFGIFTVVDNISKTAKCFFFKDVYQNIFSAYDYTEKMSGRAELIEFHSDDYAKKNLLVWGEDADYSFSYQFEISDESLQEDNTIIESEFSASRNNAIDNIAEIIKTTTGGDIIETEVRLLKNIKNPTFDSYATFYDFFEPFYQFLPQKMMRRFKRIKIWCKLTGSDVLSFDFSRPIYLQQFNEYFFVEKIEAYTKDDELTAIIAVALGIGAAAERISYQNNNQIPT